MYWWFFTSNNFICIYLFVCFILFICFAVNVMKLHVLTLHCQISSLEAIMSIKDWRLINMPSLTTTILITATEIYNNILNLINWFLHPMGRIPCFILHLWEFLCVRDAGCRGKKITEIVPMEFTRSNKSMIYGWHM